MGSAPRAPREVAPSIEASSRGGEIARLGGVIRDLHGLASAHLRSECVHEMFHEGSNWDGLVDVFRVFRHPRATTAYSWSYDATEGRQFVAVLDLMPVQCAVDAVRAAMVAKDGTSDTDDQTESRV